MNSGNPNPSTKENPGDKLSLSATTSILPGRNVVRPVDNDDLLHEIESLRTRLSELSEASRLVSESLDLDVVLRNVIDSARSLTGARYGALLTYEQSGDIQDFITSGLSPTEIESLDSLPQGLGLLGYMNEIREPLKLSDISRHPRSVGFPDGHPPMKTFMGMPIRYRDEYVGNIYLTEKEGGAEFTNEDQDILVMFASQAGAAISNARRYQEEHRARADMEALVNISPVGVVVFDARTGDLVLANDETRRLVGELRPPGRSLADLLTVLPLRRTDGSDIPMEELPTVKALTRGETILADEVVIYPPDGRSAITALVNAKPIRQEGGDIVAVVATIQDITHLEEMKRQRTEFLRNVSHELRTPLSAIKGSTSTLLSSCYPLDPAETRQFLRVIDEQSDHIRRLINNLGDMTQIEFGTLSVTPEPTDVAGLLRRAIDAHVHTGPGDNGVELELEPNLPMVMADEPRMMQVVSHLIAYVSRYASRSSSVRISAAYKDTCVAVTVDSQGGGWETPSPQRPLRSVGRVVDGVSEGRNGGDDIGIAISVGIVEAHGGRLSVGDEKEGRGSRFAFTIPVDGEAVSVAGPEGSRYPASPVPPEGQARVLGFVADPETRRYVRDILSQADLSVAVARDLDEAEGIIETQKPHVILLEPALPWFEGLETLVRICRVSGVPVIFVAGHGWNQYIGRAFELGAFDYIAKPFTSTELLARVGAALRRKSAAGWKEPVVSYLCGDLVIDYVERQVSVAGTSVHLTTTEYKVLVELSAAAGRVVSHEQLLRRVWGPLYSSDARIVRTYVKELRQKLGDDAARPTYIFTEPGVGYRMAKPSNDQRP